MKKRVVIYKKLPNDLQARLQQRFEVTCFDGIKPDNLDEFLAAIKMADGLIGSSLALQPAMLERADRLRSVATVSAGFDLFDVPDLTRRGIVLSNTPAALTETVADTVLMLMLMTARRGAELARFVKAGEWNRNVGKEWFGVDVHGKTLGIIGMGRIGMAVGRRARFGFNMNVLYHNRSRNKEAESALGANWLGLDDLLMRSDFVCALLPLSAETDKSIGVREFALMQSHAFFINAGRGRVADEAALVGALQRGQIAGAGLDVFEEEPLPVSSALLQMANVVALPHVGSATHETRYAMARDAVDNLIQAMAGELPLYAVNPEAWNN